MEKFKVCDVLNFDAGSIEVTFIGTPLKEDILEDEIRLKIRNFIDNHRHTDMLGNVTILRTILKDYKEEHLSVYYSFENGSELVVYDNATLVNFEKSVKKHSSSSENKYQVKYSSSNGISINCYDANIKDYENFQNSTKEVNDLMNYIYSLSRVEAITLTDDDKSLIEIYKLFYNENPDFSSKDLNIKVQTMMSILAGFNVTLNCDYNFSTLGKRNIPISFQLKQLVDRLYPFGEVREVEDNIKLNDFDEKKIKIVGESIRSVIPLGEEDNETLIAISKVIFANRYSIIFYEMPYGLAASADVKVDDVVKCMMLVKKINDRVDDIS